MTEVNASEESTCAPVPAATTVPVYCWFNDTPCGGTFARNPGEDCGPNDSYVKMGRVDDNRT